VVVATDDPALSAVAAEWGVDTVSPVVSGNPDSLSIIPGLLDQLASEGQALDDYTVVLPIIAPLRPRGLVDKAVRLLAAHAGLLQVLSVANPVDGLQVYSQCSPEQIDPLDQCVVLRTNHISVYSTADLRAGRIPENAPGLALPVEMELSVDLSTALGWSRAEWLVQQALPHLVYPLRQPRPLPEKVSMLVLDFDGVLTDNRVWVSEDGHEQVAAYRSDSLGINLLARAGVLPVVLSMETNPVVAARCRKMKIAFRQGIDDKPAVLRGWLAELNIQPGEVVYLGNDVNDMPCFPMVGCAVATADAEPSVKLAADLVLTRKGGYGAVRELCDILIARVTGKPGVDPV
jgi:N-acylneuraminate cytidylyltransferase